MEDVFIGFHEDTCPAVILHVIGQKPQAKDLEVLFLYLMYKKYVICLTNVDYFAI